MKILMIVPEPFFTSRGTPFSVYHRTRALCAMGHYVDIVTYPMGRDVDISGAVIHRIRKLPFLETVKIGPSLPKLFLDVFLFFRAFARLAAGRYDVVHAHEESVFFCLLYKLVFWRTKFIYDMHSSLPQQLKNFAFSSNAVLRGVFSLMEKLSIRWADAVITICPELQRTAEALRSKTPIVLIENSLIDAIDYKEKGDDIPESLIDWGKFHGKKIVLYTGTFEPYQGIPLLLESARHVLARRPDAFFVLVGGSPAQVEAMRKAAERQGVLSSVFFTGNLHPNTVKCFIRRADVLVSPRTHGNNTPLKIYEYLASGKPIVATAHETHTQVLSDREAILTPCDPGSFAAGILAALDPEAGGREIGPRAVELYRRAYGPEPYMARLRQVIQQVA